MMYLLHLLCYLAVSSAADIWENFKVSHGKSYTSFEEDLHRKNIFEQNLKYVEEHNERFREGLVTFDLKMNKFGDMTSEEFVALMTRPIGVNKVARRSFVHSPGVEMAENVDWRSKGAVTPVKDQGMVAQSGCYSAVAALEGIWFLKTGDLFDLSEQQLNDCVPPGEDNIYMYVEAAYDYIKEAGGIDSEETYGKKTNECLFNPDGVVANVTGYVDLPKEDEVAMALAVHDVGPVSVLYDAGHMSFQFYSSGIYYEPACEGGFWPNHAMTAVGYGSSEGSADYWILKNSWGTGWGEQGYVRVIRNKDNSCGVASWSCYPTV
ncbi:digestive cysteine proteinase 2-like [Palaemon carinicauda]|uniref:digestive cysteine proteinase 2-like n=1 Tax=Palaemon carinicauda TaxID=392227 RepID=UPI0035B627B0